MTGKATNRRMANWKPKPAAEAFRAVMSCPHAQMAAKAIAARDTRGVIEAGKAAKKKELDEWMDAIREPEPPPPPAATIEEDFYPIMEAVCARLCTQRSDVENESRMPRTVAARSVIACLMRKHTTWSYPSITALLRPQTTRVSHSALITMVQRTEGKLDSEMFQGAGETFRQCIAAWDHRAKKFVEANNGNR